MAKICYNAGRHKVCPYKTTIPIPQERSAFLFLKFLKVSETFFKKFLMVLTLTLIMHYALLIMNCPSP